MPLPIGIFRIPLNRQGKKLMRQLLARFARTWLGGALLSWLAANVSFAIPAKRLRETSSLLAFHHPQPSHRIHILIVPKRAYHSILDIPSDDSAFLRDLLETLRELVQELDLEQHGYRLVLNGGEYQDVHLLHFHLISD
jgi:histidine triad (HIT) family protein